MKRLVEGQKIRIDNHRRGTGSIDYYDDPANDIHLDKTTYDGRHKNEYQIRVPLNSERPVTVNSKEGKEVIPNYLLSEISAAFENKQKRIQFISELTNILNNYPLKDKGNVNIDRVFVAMKRVANCFDLGWNDKEIEKYILETKTEGVKYMALINESQGTFYLAFNKKGIVVSDFKRVGHRFVKKWKKI